MDDDGFAPNPSASGNIDIDIMDLLFDDGCWLQAADGSKFSHPTGSSSGPINLIPSYTLPEPQQQDSENWDSGSNPSAENNLIPRPYCSSSLSIPLNISWDGTGQNSIWIAPKARSEPCSSVQERLMGAIRQFQELSRDRSVLIQIWVPVKRGLKNFLITVEQPYSYDPNSSSLANYRSVSENYEFSADEDSKEGLGLPGRVFLGKAPEWTPDVRFFRKDEYPRVNEAHLCDVRGSIALPVFEKESGNCLGVVEIITTTQKISYRPELETVCKALEAVNLRSSEISNPSKEKGESKHDSIELTELFQILKTICDEHNLPLGQTWAPCNQQNKNRHWNFDKNTQCASTIDSVCYVRDPQVTGFHQACCEQQLVGCQGVVGKALMTSQPCCAIDVTEYSKAEYPLSHHAKMFDLHGALAMHLQCLFGARKSYVLEIFLPVDCQEPGLALHHRIIDSLIMLVQGSGIFCFHQKEEARPEFKLLREPVQEEKSWVSNLVEARKKGKEVAVSFDLGKEEEEFKVTNWSEAKVEPQTGPIFGECGSGNQEVSTSLIEGLGGSPSSYGSDYSSMSQKRRTKTQKNISLQELRQYFAGSLKDAARNIGVCPTTLKRICRQHGINRWPSRKIKKVGHSLKKLQLVMDSVQGAQGSIQLSSFYSNFPQLNSPTSTQTGDQQKPANTLPENIIFSSGATTSQSTSSSHTSSSSHSFSTGAKKSPIDQDPAMKRARSEAQLQILNPKSHVHLGEQLQVENLPPLPRNSKDGAVCKVKASFGEEMIRLTLAPNMGFGELQREIARRFNFEDVLKMQIKYLDDDKEWVLLTCDDDLEECIDIQRSSGCRTIKLSVHQTGPRVGD